MDDRIRKLVILGGGTAGWMTASYLGKALHDSVDITVLEAPSVPRIGVGEATIPNLQTAFFDFLGIEESEWMRECNASFKLGIKFINWRTAGESTPQPRATADGGADAFHHIFGQLPTHDGVPLSHYWLRKRNQDPNTGDFDRSCYKEPPLFDHNLAPRTLDGTRATHYAWHFDAHLVADFLRRFATEKQGVTHIEDELVEVVQDERGFVTALKTKGGRTLDGDLFVDCSGFRSLLVNKTMGEPFIDSGDHLLCDRAIASSVPHDDENDGGVEPYTSSIAMDAGWTWKIPMLGRFGSGYVYSSDFTSDDQATEDFCRLWGLDPSTAKVNRVRFRIGRNRRAWVKNVVGVGLASCFVEPLESTGIYFIYAAVYQLAKHFPDKRFDPVLADRFNREIETMFEDTRDFIQAHYYFSPRNDTEFWRANKELVLGAEFEEKIKTYLAGLLVNMPHADSDSYYQNFDVEFGNFWTNSNYYCVLAGLGTVPERPMPALELRTDSLHTAESRFADIARQQEELLRKLPTNHEFLLKLHRG
jgi:hypothetical protein